MVTTCDCSVANVFIIYLILSTSPKTKAHLKMKYQEVKNGGMIENPKLIDLKDYCAKSPLVRW